MSDERQRLLERIHADLDDDLARSVYADYLLQHETADVWHGELIRLQLDGTDPTRVAQILNERKVRVLGPLVRLFEVTWRRGFPERLRTRKWTEEHVPRVVNSHHLATIQAIEIAFMRARHLPELLEATRVTTRITELVIENLRPDQLTPLLEFAERFPRLRILGLALEPASLPANQRITLETLRAVFESRLGAQLERLQIGIPFGELDRWDVSTISSTSSGVQQLDLLEVEYSALVRHVTPFLRGDDGRLVASVDPVVAIAAELRAGPVYDLEDRIECWPREQLRALERRLVSEGLAPEAALVRDVIDSLG